MEATKAVTKITENSEYKLNPRQAAFVAYYLDPKSQTRGNAFKSAILAGFEDSYARNILTNLPEWLKDKIEEYKSKGLLAKAESNLESMLDLEVREQAMGMFGPLYEKVVTKKKVKLKNGKTVLRKVTEKVPVYKDNLGKMKIKADVSIFVAKTVGRKIYGTEGDDLPPGNSIVNLTQINIHPPTK